MIERSLQAYLLAVPALKTATKSQIYYRKAPPLIKMPWVIITNSGGMRTRQTLGGLGDNGWTRAYDTVTLYVDCTDQFQGKAISDLIVAAVENYRGDMGAEKDLLIRVESPRDLDGYQGTFRFHLALHVEYWFKTSYPAPLPVVP